MEVMIGTTNHSKTFARSVVSATVTFATEKTPSRTQLQDAIAKKSKVDAAQVVIKKIDAGFGSTSATVTAHIYDSKDDVEKLEPAFMVKKHQPKAAKTE